jgi:hypothetical protein
VKFCLSKANEEGWWSVFLVVKLLILLLGRDFFWKRTLAVGGGMRGVLQASGLNWHFAGIICLAEGRRELGLWGIRARFGEGCVAVVGSHDGYVNGPKARSADSGGVDAR